MVGEVFFTLGAVFLVMTGVEALYADMGHFGKTPIRLAWFCVVLPGLVLNYFGQGALLINHPETIENPFFHLAPEWAAFPLLLLATAAAVIASQALISGVFSITRQAIQLGYLPRLKIAHTSAEEMGQVYSPVINFYLFLATLSIVVFFQSSSQLSAAYGVAVSGTVVITLILALILARRVWKWPFWLTTFIAVTLGSLVFSFFIATLSKIDNGGWVPLLIALFMLILMTTWKKGRQILAQRLSEKAIPIERFIEEINEKKIITVPGTAVFLTGDPVGTPSALIHNVRHNKVIHKRVILVTIRTEEVPYVPLEKRVEIVQLSDSMYRVLVHYGFKETPNMKKILRFCEHEGLDIPIDETTFFLGRETLVATGRPGMAIWRERLFAFISKNSQSATTFFGIPSNKVIEVGIQVEL